ncbi:hypothetical protein T484DRAFT_2406568 [Baffinella frigidus]|nr:hypothetical protein T484DRAFT_2406568 [Cryptophyta sp. CCMP2293]
MIADPGAIPPHLHALAEAAGGIGGCVASRARARHVPDHVVPRRPEPTPLLRRVDAEARERAPAPHPDVPRAACVAAALSARAVVRRRAPRALKLRRVAVGARGAVASQPAATPREVRPRAARLLRASRARPVREHAAALGLELRGRALGAAREELAWQPEPAPDEVRAGRPLARVARGALAVGGGGAWHGFVLGRGAGGAAGEAGALAGRVAAPASGAVLPGGARERGAERARPVGGGRARRGLELRVGAARAAGRTIPCHPEAAPVAVVAGGARELPARGAGGVCQEGAGRGRVRGAGAR